MSGVLPITTRNITVTVHLIRLANAALSGALVAVRWNVALKVQAVVEDPHDLDRAVRRGPNHQEVTSATSPSRNVERAKARCDLIAGLGACKLGIAGEFADRLDEGVAIDARLPRAKILDGPSEDIGEVELGGSTETNAPPTPGHEGAIRLFGR